MSTNKPTNNHTDHRIITKHPVHSEEVAKHEIYTEPLTEEQQRDKANQKKGVTILLLISILIPLVVVGYTFFSFFMSSIFKG